MDVTRSMYFTSKTIGKIHTKIIRNFDSTVVSYHLEEKNRTMNKNTSY